MCRTPWPPSRSGTPITRSDLARRRRAASPARRFSNSAISHHSRNQGMRINSKYFMAGSLSEDTRSQATGGDKQNGGIENPKQQHLRANQFYYRFASSTAPQSCLNGAWWLEFETFNKIRNFARASIADGSSSDARREAVRYCLALPWGQCDRLVRALFIQEVEVYRGVGRVARGHTKVTPTGDSVPTRYIPPQHIKELYQLYIPGMQEFSSKILSNVTNEFLWASPYFK
jgi:hypothetical protein